MIRHCIGDQAQSNRYEERCLLQHILSKYRLRGTFQYLQYMYLLQFHLLRFRHLFYIAAIEKKITMGYFNRKILFFYLYSCICYTPGIHQSSFERPLKNQCPYQQLNKLVFSHYNLYQWWQWNMYQWQAQHEYTTRILKYLDRNVIIISLQILYTNRNTNMLKNNNLRSKQHQFHPQMLQLC